MQTRRDRELERYYEHNGTVSIQWEPPPPPSPGDDHDPEPALMPQVEVDAFFIDWTTFWDKERLAEDWVFEPILARGRAHSIYAGHKQGKSLLTVFMVAQIAVEKRAAVIYLDYEMTEDDLAERLEEMGYGPDTDLSYLHYALLPSLPPLDTKAGAAEMERLINTVQALHEPDTHIVVIIDTTSRAIEGEENSADTIRAFYRHTGLLLKQRGVTSARLDHAGKDTSRGQRGSSAKGDDVDVVWALTRTEHGVRLHRDAARMSWVPEDINLAERDDPLRFIGAGPSWPAGTKDLANLLDHLNVDPKMSTREVQALLKEKGEGRRAELVRAAVKYRRQTGWVDGTHPGTHSSADLSDALRDAQEENHL